jgi:hypothetical protein
MPTRSALILFFSCTFALNFDLQAQSEAESFTAKNTLSVELGGNVLRYAVNYGRLFHQNGSFKLSASVGFSMWHETLDNTTYWNPALPLEITALYGKSKHHLEAGTGITPFLQNRYTFQFRPTSPSRPEVVKESTSLGAVLPFRIGYRYQKPEGGFFFRAAYTPFSYLPLGDRESWSFYPIFVGFSFGKSF